ncbi:hypothetical protein IRZ83_02360 [Flavobacterium sp. JLP]|uniref:hypothetical protein n=1 Tax=Flavobacterium sp. JLP TaxID=2783793 RepID=UPI00188AC5C5|nr:hypothetical protein [Flavobacterium sp. JLP]MBF4505492.1 hypothetical protein [Flavobacterium sp. JLP]
MKIKLSILAPTETVSFFWLLQTEKDIVYGGTKRALKRLFLLQKKKHQLYDWCF